MPEFLIRVVDKGAPINYSKRGDVISVCPDGWPWTQEELTRDDWRIVSVLGIAQTAIDAALAGDPPDSVKPVDQRLRRTWMIDFSLLPNPALFSGVRTQQIISLTKQQAGAALVKKP